VPKPNIECHFASITHQIGWHQQNDDGSMADTDYVYDWQPLNITVSIDNSGDGDAQAFRARLFIDDREHQDVKVQPLAAGAQQWVEWFHDPLPEGTHVLKVVCDYKGTVHESDETDNTYTQEFTVLGSDRQQTIDFGDEPIEIVGDPTEKEWRDAGWTKAYVQFIMHDVDEHGVEGAPLAGEFTVDFEGKAGETHHVDTSTNGVVAFDDIWISKIGSVAITGLVGDVTLLGSDEYRDATDALTFKVQRKHWSRKLMATSEEEAAEKFAAEVNAGLDVEIVSIGVSGSTESSSSQKSGRSQEWEVHGRSLVLGISQTGPAAAK